MTIREDVERLRAIPAEWKQRPDPLGDLRQMRTGEPQGMTVEVVQPKEPEPIVPLRFLERLAIANAVQRTGNPKKAADALGIGHTTIYRLLRVYGIVTPYRIGKNRRPKPTKKPTKAKKPL